MIKLYPYQEANATALVSALSEYRAVLDASDTGVGKTMVALGVAKELGVEPLILCPKSVITSWKQASKGMGVEPLGILNIEKLKTGKTPYLKTSTKISNRGKKTKVFTWTLPRGTFLIWDEVQNASSYDSQNSEILALTRAYGINTLAMSATIGNDPTKLKALGYLLGLHCYKDHYSWCMANGCHKGRWGGIAFTTNSTIAEINLTRIHKQIFPDRGVRTRVSELDTFPENAIFADAYDMAQHKAEINKIYQELDDAISNPDEEQNPLVLQLRTRQRVEACKVPLLKEMTVDLLDEKKSVVIFVNFKDTLAQLTQALKGAHPLSEKCSLIYGGQKQSERDEAIRLFQADENRVLVCMIQAGGVGISLHDMHGNHPRVTLICPTFHAVQLKQALGRTPRSGGKSKCIQRLIFAAGTIEEKACSSVKTKLSNLSLLNDGDLSGGLHFAPQDSG